MFGIIYDVNTVAYAFDVTKYCDYC